MKKIAFLFSAFLFLFSFSSSSCLRNNVRCKISRDCPSSMVCGSGGKCISQCNATRDCHEDQKCVEGECKKIR